MHVRMLHAESLKLFGGRPGLRDEHLLESALARPRQLYVYGQSPSLSGLAAEYGYGLARNHAFVDGNKRVALLAIRAFLFVNGMHFMPEQAGAVMMIEALAAGRVERQELAEWIERCCVSQPKRDEP